MSTTLFDKVWDSHVVSKISNGPDVLFIDRHMIHEVTSPVAFLGLKNRGVKVLYTEKTFASADHNTPTINQHLPVLDKLSANQLKVLEENSEEHGILYWGLGHEKNGIVHVVGPEYGITQPGATIVCGDSHTSTHGAFGAIAFGIGTSEVEMVLSTQCILQPKPKKMRITIKGELQKGVTPKDVALFIISKLTTSGATGHFVEYAGDVFTNMTMEGRMTVCNLSIEMGARGGMIAPDEKTFDFIVVNYANPDMVGHTGSFEATKQACEALDICLGRVLKAIKQTNSVMLLTADHGNAELMYDEKLEMPHTRHTLNPVPFHLINSNSNASLGVPSGQIL